MANLSPPSAGVHRHTCVVCMGERALFLIQRLAPDRAQDPPVFLAVFLAVFQAMSLSLISFFWTGCS